MYSLSLTAHEDIARKHVKSLKDAKANRAARDVYLKREIQRLHDELEDALFRVDKFLKLLNNVRQEISHENQTIMLEM